MTGRFFVLFHPYFGYYTGHAYHRKDVDRDAWTDDPMLATPYGDFERARTVSQRLPCWTSLEVREVAV